MQCLKRFTLRHFRLQASLRTCSFTESANILHKFIRQLGSLQGRRPDNGSSD
ncbi:hypothetical protein SOVF_109600 [Spinacia oleracea]|nr:hypothetical protein SOVF_109600 [Spinacia oleracea]